MVSVRYTGEKRTEEKKNKGNRETMTKANPNPYPFIYTNQCIYCYNEGRPQCHLEETENNKCKNYTTQPPKEVK